MEVYKNGENIRYELHVAEMFRNLLPDRVEAIIENGTFNRGQ